MKNIWMILLLFLLGSDAAASSPVSVSLRFEPAHTIPGVPVQIVYTVRNLTAHSITVPSTISLIVRTAGDEPFYANWDGRRTIATLPGADNPFVLKPNEERVFVDWFNPRLAGPAWFADRRLCGPGLHSVTAVMGEERRLSVDKWEIPLSGEGNPEDPAMKFATVLSNEAELLVEQPTGDEAIIWDRMKKLTNNDGWGVNDWVDHGSSIAEEVWRSHLSSKYAQPVAYLVSSPRELRARHLKAAIDLDPKSIIADNLRLLLVGLKEAEMGEAMLPQSRDLSKAMASRKATEDLLKSLVDSHNTGVRLKARELLGEFPSESELRSRIKELN